VLVEPTFKAMSFDPKSFHNSWLRDLQTRPFLSITAYPTVPLVAQKIPFWLHIFFWLLVRKQSEWGSVINHHESNNTISQSYSKNYSKSEERWKPSNRKNVCLPLSAHDYYVWQNHVICLPLFIIIRMNESNSEILFPSPIKLA
jgi:hypothetical protein